MKSLDDKPIVLDDAKIDEMLENLVKTEMKGNLMNFIVIVHDEELYQKDVMDGQTVKKELPKMKENFAESIAGEESRYPIVKVCGYDFFKNE